MNTPARPEALDALTDADTAAIGVALIGYIKEIEHSLTTGGDPLYWQPRIEAARTAFAHVVSIRAAS